MENYLEWGEIIRGLADGGTQELLSSPPTGRIAKRVLSALVVKWIS